MVDTIHPPPSVIASWPAPNYVDPHDDGPALLIITIVFSTIGVLSVLARLYARICLTRAPGIDDVLIVLGLIFALALSGLVLVGKYKYYTGYHIWDVPKSAYPGQRIFVWVSEWMYLASACAIKISVLLFYRRLSVSFNNGFLVAVWVGIIYNLGGTIGAYIYELVSCLPLEAYWNQFNPEWVKTHTWYCTGEQVSLPLYCALSVVGDLYATILPAMVIHKIPRSRRQKIALYALFGLGFLVVGVGICRTVFNYIVVNVDYDFTHALNMSWIFSLVELYTAIFAASAPALKPFFKHFCVHPITKRNEYVNMSEHSLTGSRSRSTPSYESGCPHCTNSCDICQPKAGSDEQSSSRHSSVLSKAGVASLEVIEADMDPEKIGVAEGYPEDFSLPAPDEEDSAAEPPSPPNRTRGAQNSTFSWIQLDRPTSGSSPSPSPRSSRRSPEFWNATPRVREPEATMYVATTR